MNKPAALLILAACSAIALAACGGGQGSHQHSNAGSSASAGETDAAALYKKHCLSCHAADLSGKVGPNLQKAGAKLTREQLADKIRNGGGGMPAFKNALDEQAIQSLAEWLGSKT